jgi:hypothetical protein
LKITFKDIFQKAWFFVIVTESVNTGVLYKDENQT